MVEIKELLDAGVHFGHARHLWNPKMARYIYGAKNNVYVIDLEKTVKKFAEAFDFLRGLAASGGSLLFVGTKYQAQSIIEEAAQETGMFYVTQRWLGGMLTNFTTIRRGVDRLKKLEESRQDGTYDKLPKKEVMQLEKERIKLDRNLAGIRKMDHLPRAVFIVDIVRERICVAEARRLNIPIVAIVDTNCDPDDVDYPIPANDDGIRSIRLVTRKVIEAIQEGAKQQAVPNTRVTSGAEESNIIPSVEKDTVLSGTLAPLGETAKLEPALAGSSAQGVQ